MLSAPRPRTIAEVVDGLGMVQLDPTSAVARTEHLVLWSRLGKRFRIAELERMLWDERLLFEYWVHIVPASDLAIHRETMRRYPIGPRGDQARRTYIRGWLDANAAFRRYVLRELRRRGPLRARDLEDRVAEGWSTGGWNDQGRNVAMMLDLLWFKGEVMIVGRYGQQRLWNLTERSLSLDGPRLSQREVARRIVERQLRAWGVAKPSQFGWAFDGRPPGWDRALVELIKEGVAIPARVEGDDADRYVHAEIWERTFRPRTTLLSPFDDLISDRDHTEQLFDFFFRLEIYVPKAKREFGYLVMPILHGDRLIGRIDPRLDRATQVLHVNAVYAEKGAPASAGPAVSGAIRELGEWLGAADIRFTRKVPAMWRTALRT